MRSESERVFFGPLWRRLALVAVIVVAGVFAGGKLWHAVFGPGDDYTGNGKRDIVIQIKDGDSKIRIFVPIGQITTVGEITYSDEDVIGYQVTVEAFPDEDGNQAYKFIDDGKTADNGGEE